jgi:glycosyltransferase involved in cell wall biosynthesis
VSTSPTVGPVVVFLPARNEAARIVEVIGRIPRQVAGRSVEIWVVDDGSNDDTAHVSASAGAQVRRHPRNRGLGAAVRTGLALGVERGASATVFFDADGEYAPEDLDAVVAPILEGSADYVVGSRFAGSIEHMRPHRRLGNMVLTRWVRWMVRQPVTDGQSGYRALSNLASQRAVIEHDYNYAQVLTINLVGQGFVMREVPIRYRFRTSGRSFVRLSRYLRAVIPASRLAIARVNEPAASTPTGS